MNFQVYQQRIQDLMEHYLPEDSQAPLRLQQAMRYAVFNGGKRIRPLLVYATGQIFNTDLAILDPAAAAVELIHCYSLIHDDLPAMDDDDLRRGKPTCHRAFDEATAILAGDALQTLAFKILTDIDHGITPAPKILTMLTLLADACGSHGMAGGQTLDLEAEGRQITLAELEKIHHLKTGALISASIQLAAIASNANSSQLTALENFAFNMGLAFQIQDDIIDVTSTTEELGKRQGADQALNKPTYVSLLGINEAQVYLQDVYEKALQFLSPFAEQAANLRALAAYIVQRHH